MEFAVHVVVCTDTTPGWSAPRPIDAHQIVFVRRGGFRVRSDGERLTADPSLGYLLIPGRDHRVSHPMGGDACTTITVGDRLWHEVTQGRPVRAGVPVDGRLELAHRLLLRGADPEPLVRALELVAAVPASHGRPELAALAREAVLSGVPDASDLVRLARTLGVSPGHLSRTFHAHCGMTFSRYRNRVRVSGALARIEQGETDLARLAAELGFADQAHLARTVRRETGRPPGRIRDLFTGPVRQASLPQASGVAVRTSAWAAGMLPRRPAW
ncbi:helix-turn-helix transcriptional regulator [Microtetraspora sp. AC03309]|uniref:helix-turn-helix domain-containing protein n=1 Tax=Microtetraspora sp. AC03309 TaxID=2779376 RepID=UPI001E59DD83|nr:helix-turn-helix transcriptional regulator [Microtetraspora sp. AC03309]MCC5578779.1 helix-turn-helix transcriptional regulator [Microtetraspora sp. AC03309]